MVHKAQESHSLVGKMMDLWWEHSTEPAIADVGVSRQDTSSSSLLTIRGYQCF